MVVCYFLLPPETPTQTTLARFDEQQRYGGTLVWGTRNPASMINPILWNQDSSAALTELIFNSLVKIDSKGQIIPDLAESWEVSEDGLTYTFHLREGVRFHDGKELTAEDVRFTYKMISDPANNSPWRTNTELVESWEVVDKYILKITLREPFPPILFKLVREIVPRHLLEGQDLRVAAFNYAPVGSGPFQFANWDKLSGRIELEANADYYEGRPYLDRIVVKSYPDNEALWAALMRQEIDLVKFINRQDYLVIKGDPTFKAYEFSWRMYCAMAYNIKDPILSDLRVRQAIAYSINRPRIIHSVSDGAGIESVGPFHPTSMGFNENVQPFEYNPQKALAMLGKRGWKDADGNGVLEKNGQELVIKLLVDARGGMYQKMAAVIRQQLSEVGIKIKVQLYNGEGELTEEYLSRQQPQAWLRFFSGEGFEVYEPSQNWYSLSSESARLWNYKNPEVDRLFELARSTPDKKKRQNIYQEIHKIIYYDQPASFLFYPASFHAVSAKVQNTDTFFSPYMPGYELKHWYLVKDLQVKK
jgi:peptide/nickel transport system substrate-binding protein